jgi:hypothetical protein
MTEGSASQVIVESYHPEGFIPVQPGKLLSLEPRGPRRPGGCAGSWRKTLQPRAAPLRSITFPGFNNVFLCLLSRTNTHRSQKPSSMNHMRHISTAHLYDNKFVKSRHHLSHKSVGEGHVVLLWAIFNVDKLGIEIPEPRPTAARRTGSWRVLRVRFKWSIRSSVCFRSSISCAKIDVLNAIQRDLTPRPSSTRS